MSDSSRDGLLAVCGSMLVLSGATVALRFYVRRGQAVPILGDEIFALMAWVINLGSIICVFLLVHWKSLGYSIGQVSPAQMAKTAKQAGQVELAYSVLRPISLACIKLSALFFYRRIFCVGQPRGWVPALIKVSIVIVALWLVVFEFLTGFECGTHVDALWNRAQYAKYCTIVFPYLYGLAISDLLLDIWVLALPIPDIMSLHASLRKRLSITGVFLLSFIGLAASIGRVVVYAAIEDGGPTYFATHDEERVAVALTRTFFFDMLEAGMTIIAVNLPSLWQLASRPEVGEFWRSLYSVMTFKTTERRDSETRNASNEVNLGWVEEAHHHTTYKSWAGSPELARAPETDNSKSSLTDASQLAHDVGYDAAEYQQMGSNDDSAIFVSRSINVQSE